MWVCDERLESDVKVSEARNALKIDNWLQYKIHLTFDLHSECDDGTQPSAGVKWTQVLIAFVSITLAVDNKWFIKYYSALLFSSN